MDRRYDNIVEHYFEIMSNKNKIMTEERVHQLDQLNQEFLRFYSSFDATHVFLRGLIYDATYMLNQQINQTQTKTNINETKEDVTDEKTEDTVVSSSSDKSNKTRKGSFTPKPDSAKKSSFTPKTNETRQPFITPFNLNRQPFITPSLLNRQPFMTPMSSNISNKTTQPNITISKAPSNQQKIFAHSSKLFESGSKFGETTIVYENMTLLDTKGFMINTEMRHSEYAFTFYSNQYLLNSQTCNIHYGIGYLVISAYTYLVNKHKTRPGCAFVVFP